ncbi:hypothetical protein Tco_1408615 [Tanacetum coccineum]
MQRKTQSWKDTKRTHILIHLGHTGEIHSLNDVVVDQMHQPWRTFAALINRSLSGKTSGLEKLRLSRAQILWVIIHYFLTKDKTLSWRNKIGMQTSRDDYLINTLRFVSAKEETQIYGAILPESLTSPEMKETKVYKTYFGFATGATPPKKARKFKKPASPKLTTVPVSAEEPTRKSMRVKRHAKKYTKAPAKGVVIRETPERPLKSMRDFHKTHPSGSGAVKIIPLVTSEDDSNNEQDSSGEDSDQENGSDNDRTQSDNDNDSNSKHETDENESGSEFDQEENKEDEDDEEEVKDELVKTPSNDSDDEDETKITDKGEGDEDEEIDYTTSQLYNDVDIRLNELVDSDKGFAQEEGTNAAMTTVQQGNENPNILQVIEDVHVTLLTVPQKTEVPVTSSSHSSDLAAKFLNFSDIPHTDAEIVSPMDVHVHHEVPS